MREIENICEKLEELKNTVRECLLSRVDEEYHLSLEKTLLRLHQAQSELQQKITLI